MSSGVSSIPILTFHGFVNSFMSLVDKRQRLLPGCSWLSAVGIESDGYPTYRRLPHVSLFLVLWGVQRFRRSPDVFHRCPDVAGAWS